MRQLVASVRRMLLHEQRYKMLEISYNGRFVITEKDRSDLQENLNTERCNDQIEEREFPSLGKNGTKYYMQFAKCQT